MIKTLKIRLHPTTEQEAKMWQHTGAARFIWNWALRLEQDLYHNGGKFQRRFDLIKILTRLKQYEEYEWLNGVSNTMLQVVMTDLSKAYEGFFKKRSGFPKYKSRKRSKPAFPICTTNCYFSNGSVNVEKVGKVCYSTNYDVPQGKLQQFQNCRVAYVNGKWILTVALECENQARELTDKAMGIDLGIKDLATVAYGDEVFKVGNINKSKRVRNLTRKKKHLQRKLARKYRVNGFKAKTRGITETKAQIAEIDYRLANIRRNHIHQTTHRLIELLPSVIVTEDLNVTGMMKNRHLSKAIQEQCFTEFIRQIKYKSEWAGIEFIQADRWYPSSKTCSNCGAIKASLKLSDRVYVCDECGEAIDRDENAALNLMRYASHDKGLAA